MAHDSMKKNYRSLKTTQLFTSYISEKKEDKKKVNNLTRSRVKLKHLNYDNSLLHRALKNMLL